jgi:hypothetical protein
MEKMIRVGIGLSFNQKKAKGKTKLAKIELKETYLEVKMVIKKTTIEHNEAIGKTAIIKPNTVATPLPPLNPT